jgi:hypothetical protein
LTETVFSFNFSECPIDRSSGRGGIPLISLLIFPQGS